MKEAVLENMKAKSDPLHILKPQINEIVSELQEKWEVWREKQDASIEEKGKAIVDLKSV